MAYSSKNSIKPMKNKIFLFLLSLIIVMPAIPSFGNNGPSNNYGRSGNYRRSGTYDRDESHFGEHPSVRTMRTKKWKKPNKTRGKFDEKSYYLGKDIYENKIKLPENHVSEKAFDEQSRTLNKLKKKLPVEVVNNLDKAEFIGRLEIDQMGSLIYFLKMRFSKL